MQTSTLIYTSRATTPVTMHSLEELAEKAARKNALVGVTGLLLYGSGNYFQVLEGSQGTLKMLYERIGKDRRHTGCQLLFEHDRPARLFPSWNMGQMNLDNPANAGQNQWEIICSTLSRSGAIDWKTSDPVIGWVREFMDQNRNNSAA